MWSIFKRLVLVIAVLVLIVLGIGWILPRGFSVETQARFPAEREQVFQLLVDLETWPKWAPSWGATGSPIEISHGPTTQGENASMTWRDPRGTGKLWITTVIEPARIEYRSEFTQFPIMEWSVDLSQQGDDVVIDWRCEGKLADGPFYGWFAAMVPGGLKSQLDRDLANLAIYVKNHPTPLPANTD